MTRANARQCVHALCMLPWSRPCRPLNVPAERCARLQVHAEINVKRLLAHNSLKHELLEGFNFFRVRSMGVVEPKDFTSQWRLDQCDPGMFQPFIARANAIRKLATK